MAGHYGVPLERSDCLPLAANEHSCTAEDFGSWLETFGRGRRLAVDLFSGAGGLSFGLEQAGWTVAAAVDFDERALETHRANFPGMSLHMDLGNPEKRAELLELLAPADIDLVAGGPPCQPFSRAGRSKIRHLVENHNRDPRDLRKELWRAYLEIVIALRPRVILMENVPDMGLSDDFRVIREIKESLEDEGYATHVKLVDAWNYGVPQHRKRLIFLARRDIDRFEWAPPQKERTTLRHAIEDLPPLDVVPLERVGEREMPYVKPTKLSAFAKSMRDGAPRNMVWDHMTRRVRSDDYRIFSVMDSKTLYSDLKDMLAPEEQEFQRYKADQFTDKYKKLDWDDLSRTITAHIAKDGYWYIHPTQHRTLTVREAARVQTFPDRFRFAGTRSDAFRQIGNAVPPLLGKAAADVLQPVEGLETPSTGLVSHWKQVREALTRWALDQQETDNWYKIPSAEPVPLHAAVAAVLSGTKIKPSDEAAMMASIRKARTLTAAGYARLLGAAPTAASRARVERLLPLVDQRPAWSPQNHEKIPDRLDMKPSEKSLYRLLAGDDIMFVGSGALRVAARVNGVETDHSNRLTEGRVNMIKLVGSGKHAPARMAALRLLGSDICREQQTVCSDCPLAAYCPRKDETPTIF